MNAKFRALETEVNKNLRSRVSIKGVKAYVKHETVISKTINKCFVTTRNFTTKVPNGFQTMH